MNLAEVRCAYLVICIIILSIFYGRVAGFNINTDRIYRQFSGNADSYFGFALAFMNTEWLLVGAPRDNDTFISSVREPGRLFRCPMRTNDLCEPISIDNKTGNDDFWSIYFTQGRDGAWLGASIDVPFVDPNKGIVVCAPKWYNRRLGSEYFMNGLCYALPMDLNPANIEKFPILVPRSGQTKRLENEDKTIINHGMAAMGMAVHYTESNRDLLLGAPGLVDWTGGFIRKRSGRNYVEMKSSFEEVFNTNNQYIGQLPLRLSSGKQKVNGLRDRHDEISFSATSGTYFLDRQEYYVMGAPRSELVGKVYFFAGGLDSYLLQNASLELSPIDKGNTVLPMNSYFGASLCTTDINDDGYDDLLVGAPLYGNPSYNDGASNENTIDIGRVYLFLGKKELGDFGRSFVTLTGDSLPGARFGSAIQGLGDINKDGYNDVVVGAPYEDDNRGAVYVYNGYKDGLWPIYSQKIIARQLDTALLSFGHSISKPMDINSDEINDIAIGSYLSSHVTVLVGQPVINMAAMLMVTEDSVTDLHIIDQNSNTTYIRVCFQYAYRQCSRVTLNVSISLDVEKTLSPRVYFKSNQKSTKTLEVDSFSGDITCSSPVAGGLIMNPSFDLVSPIKILVQYEMVSNSCPIDSNPTISKFDGNNPGDPLLLLHKELLIKNECEDNNCTTDLHLHTEAIYENVDGFFVVGTPSLVFDINITKTGDPSYGSIFRMTIPNTLKYRKQDQTFGEETVSCSLENSVNEDESRSSKVKAYNNESLLECSFGNPLRLDTGVGFKLYFQVPGTISAELIEFRMEVLTLSYELNDTDNNKTLEIKMKNHVDASLSGVSDPDTLLIQEYTDSYDLTHIYELENRGPSSLPTASVKIFYPQIQSGGVASLYLNRTKVRCGRPCEIECGTENKYSLPPIWMENNGRNYYINANSTTSTLTTLRYLNCDGGECLTLACTLSNLAAQQSVSIKLDFVVSKTIEGILKSQRSTQIMSKATADLRSSTLIADNTVLQHKLKTVLLPRVPPKTGVAWWIILVSVLCGLILIILLMFILYKCGFFKRKRFPQPAKPNNDDKQKLSDDKESVSLTDSENDIIDKNGKSEKY